jgi:hypothetical protein
VVTTCFGASKVCTQRFVLLEGARLREKWDEVLLAVVTHMSVCGYKQWSTAFSNTDNRFRKHGSLVKDMCILDIHTFPS